MSDLPERTVPVYIVHMNSQPKRWEVLEQRLSHFPSLNPVLVEAIDGNAIPEADRLSGIHWSYPYRTGCPAMTAGELGCALSHTKAWTALQSSDAPWSAVFEDDVLLSDRLEEAMQASASLLETQSPTIVLLSTNIIAYRKPAASIGGFSFHSLVSGAGAYAYLLNRSAADCMIGRVRPLKTPVDWWRPKIGWGIRVFALVPHVASYSEDRSDSLLEGPRKELWKARARLGQSLGMRVGVLLFREMPSIWWRLLFRFHYAVLFPKQW